MPTIYQILINHPAAEKYDTGSLTRCTISATPVSEELYRAFTTKFDCEIYEGYGLTVALGAVDLGPMITLGLGDPRASVSPSCC